MTKSWYSRSKDIEYKDGHIEKEYHLVFETTDKELARRIEEIFHNIMDGIKPERKKGKWIKGVGENGITTSEFCSCCRYENKHWCDWNFCPNCGADMREDQDD